MPNQNIKLSGFPKFWVGELSARVAVPGTEASQLRREHQVRRLVKHVDDIDCKNSMITGEVSLRR